MSDNNESGDSGDSDDEKKTVYVKVDADTYEIAMEQLGHGDLSEIVRDLMFDIAHGAGYDRAQLHERMLARDREQLRRTRSKQDRLQTEEEQLEARIAEREGEQAETKSREARIDGALWQFEQGFRAGEYGHIEPSHGMVTALSKELKIPADKLIDTLRERNPDVPNKAFEPIEPYDSPLGGPFRGVSEDRVDLPLESRE